MQTLDLDSLIPRGIEETRSLVGSFDGRKFNGAVIDGVSRESTTVTELECQEAPSPIELALSDVKFEQRNRNGSDAITANGVFLHFALGRAYSEEQSQTEFIKTPYLLARIEIISDEGEECISYIHGNHLTIIVRLPEALYPDWGRELGGDYFSRIQLDAELWRSKQGDYYIRMQNQTTRGNAQLFVLEDVAALKFDFDGLTSAALCRYAGEEINHDPDESSSSRNPARFIRIVVTALEIIAGLLVVYWSMH
jgi:hypothetical protein